nr:dihydroneopterin aldolase [uncultured bacterium]
MISDLRLWAHLGCSPEERHHLQAVGIDIQLVFVDSPKAIETDELEDTICYYKITKAIEAVVASKPFHLIEHMAKSVYDVIVKTIPKDLLSKIEVKVCKVSPPMAGVLGGVSFVYSA